MDFDVLGLGAISIDLTGMVKSWPEKGFKTRLDEFSIHDGGLTGTALVTAARLGAKVGIAARLGYSEMAERAIWAFRKEHVDTSNIVRLNNAEPVISIVISLRDGADRNIFFSRNNVSYPFPDEFPDRKWYKHTRVLILDHGTGKAGLETAIIARENGLQVIIDAERDEPYLGDILKYCNHIVVARKFAEDYTAEQELENMLYSLRKSSAQHIVITLGSEGAVGLSGKEIFKIPGHHVDVVDTTGCGDVFHGAYAFSIASGKNFREAVIFSNAAAALSARSTGGRAGIPLLNEVHTYLESIKS